MDLKVKQVQEWLIATYRDRQEFADFLDETEFATSDGYKATGITSTNTMKGLIYALQYELNISEPTGVVGPVTLRYAPIINMDNASEYSEHIIKILEGGLWCHGYSAGYSEEPVMLEDGSVTNDFGGTFDTDTISAIIDLQTDIGLDNDYSNMGEMTPLLWKSLLSTDAFVTTWTGGSEDLREAQQYLNWFHINGFDFAEEFLGGYIPTDGLGGRKLSTALIYYLQAIIGMYASEATGTLGPVTQSGLVTVPNNLPTDLVASKHFVRLVVFSLLANGYNVPISSNWNDTTARIVKKFQLDMSLKATGVVDFTTWMALLISYGDKNRSYTCCDTRFEITSKRLALLKTMGIKAVGRYLTGTDFKVLRNGELQRIVDGGLGLIPIFQGDGTSGDSFSYEKGRIDAVSAQQAALKHGIPLSSIIYFAVDYDPQDWEIQNKIIPYFQGVRTALLNDKNYVSGIYGTRNVCSQVLERVPEVVTCYVSNMSSGYSGNLGYKMPPSWNFDQFDEIEIQDWGIDKVVYSGSYPFVTSYMHKNVDQISFDPLANPINQDDVESNPIALVNFGSTLQVYESKRMIPGQNSMLWEGYGKLVGKIETGQCFTCYRLLQYGDDISRVVFADSKGGSVKMGYIDVHHVLTYDVRLFHAYNYDPATNSLIENKADDYSSGASLEFVTSRELTYFGSDTSTIPMGVLPKGTTVLLSKYPTSHGNGEYYSNNVVGLENPTRLRINQYILNGVPVYFDNEDFVWLDLNYSNGSIGALRSLY